MKIIDDNSKKLHWWNRNYFFACTIAVVLVNILLYGLCGNNWESQFKGSSGATWGNVLDFKNFVRAFMNSYSHSNWQHVLLNMLCFFIYGIYLERKEGTLPLLVLVFMMTFFSAVSISANDQSVGWHGFSGVNFAFYGYVIVDFIFVFRKRTRTPFNIISGIVILGLIYFAACFCGGTSTVEFKWYPYDFMHNMGHYSGFVAGVFLGVLIHLCRFKAEREEPCVEKSR